MHRQFHTLPGILDSRAALSNSYPYTLRVIPKTIIKMVQTASLHRHACVRVGVWQCSPTVKGRVVCGTFYGEMHLKDLLGSFVRVGYRIPVPDFYLVLHGLRCRKSIIMD